VSEERAEYLLNSEAKQSTLSDKVCTDFVEVRTRRGKLLFRFDAARMLVEWRDGQERELIDLLPYLTR